MTKKTFLFFNDDCQIYSTARKNSLLKNILNVIFKRYVKHDQNVIIQLFKVHFEVVNP